MSFRSTLSLGLLSLSHILSPAIAQASGQRCPTYCVGTTLYTSGWHPGGHGEPGWCGAVSATPDAPACGFELDLAERLSYHSFRSSDGFYALNFHGLDSNIVDISIGPNSEAAHFTIADHEISFVDTAFAEAKGVWFISKDEQGICSGDLRVKLDRVGPL